MTDESEIQPQPLPVDPEQIVLPEDVASAGRSCSAVIVLFAVLVLLICVGLAWRWTIVH